MNSKFLRANIFVIIIALGMASIGILYLSKIGHQNFIYLPLKETSSGFKIIGSAILITLFLERALEILMNLWREPNKIKFKAQAKEVQNQIDKLNLQINEAQKEINESTDLPYIEERKTLITLKEEVLKVQNEILSGINLKLDDYK